MEVEKLLVRLIGDTAPYTQSLRKAAQDTQNFQKAIQTQGKATAFAGVATTNLTKSFATSIGTGIRQGLSFGAIGLSGMVDGFLRGAVGGFVSGMGNGLMSFITAPLGALLGGVSALASGIVRGAMRGFIGLISGAVHITERLAASMVVLGTEFERVSVSFEVMTGSAETGMRVLGDLRNVAIQSPYTFRQLANPTQMLLGMGVAARDVIPIVSRLGDVAAGDSERLGRLALAYGQVMAAGRFMGTELRQFTESGVGVEDFAQTMGLAASQFRSMMSAGLIGPDVVARTLIRITNEGGRFANMNQRINKTVGGSWNALTESIELGLGKMGIAFFGTSGLAKMLQELSASFISAVPMMERWGRQLGAFLNPLIRSFRELLTYSKELAGTVFDGLFGNLDQSKNPAEAFTKAMLTGIIALEQALAKLLLRLDQAKDVGKGVWAAAPLAARAMVPNLGFAEKEDLDKRHKDNKARQAEDAVAKQEEKVANAANRLKKAQADFDAIKDPEKAGNFIDRWYRRNRRSFFGDQIAIEKARLEKEEGKLKELQKKSDEADGQARQNPFRVVGRAQKAIEDIRKVDPAKKAQDIIDSMNSKITAPNPNIFGKPEVLVHHFTSAWDQIRGYMQRNGIEIPGSMAEKLDKFLKSFADKVGKGVTDYEQLITKAALLENYANKEIYQFGPVHPDDVENSKFEDIRKAGFYSLFKDRLKQAQEVPLPRTAAIGTSEAQDILNRGLSMNQTQRDVQQQTKDILEEMKKEMEEYYKDEAEVNKVMKEFFSKNPQLLKAQKIN